MNNIQEHIKEIFSTHFNIYSEEKFIDELKCSEGMCKCYSEKGIIYQFLPNPIPNTPAEFVFICKEPSDGWAKNSEDAKKRVIDGNMNFIGGEFKKLNSDILFIAFREVFGDKSIYITDMSKCAMNTNDADEHGLKENLIHRYECCSPFLKWELTKLTEKNFHIFVVGINYFFNAWYKKKGFLPKNVNNVSSIHKFLSEVVKVNVPLENITMIPHYSIRFSCPENILKLLKLKDVDLDEIRKDLKNNFINLYEYYLKNFKFTIMIEKNIKNLIKRFNESDFDKNLSNSLIVLYMIYKREFEIAKEKWKI